MVSLSRLKDLLHYCPETGLFTWVKITSYRVRIGAIAGKVRSPDGYIGIGVDGRKYLAHRLAWFYSNGSWPRGQIDHINGMRTDNRIANLRDVDRAINCQNHRRAHSHSATGLLGAYPAAGGPGYRAQITINKRQIHLGVFATADEAHAAYLNAKRRLHPGGTL